MRMSPVLDTMSDAGKNVTVFLVFISKPALMYCGEDIAGVSVVWKWQSGKSLVEADEVLYKCNGKIWMAAGPYEEIAIPGYES